MKKLSLILIALVFSPAIHAADMLEAPIQDFAQGVWTYPSQNRIPDNAVAYSQNFVFDVEPMGQERNGYVRRDSTTLGNPSAVYQLAEFVDSSGNDWIISYSSRTYYKNTVGGTPTAFGQVTTVDQIPDFAKNLGLICFVNGTDSMWCFDGTSTTTISGAPVGKRIAAWRTRFAISNITGAQSTIRFSADGSSSNWTLGGNAVDPFAVQIGGANDGEYVRCLAGSYQDSMIIGRKYDLWALDGTTQADYILRNISLQVGCIEPRTMKEDDGELVWLSARGLEAMDGRAIRTISEPVRNITDIIAKNTTNQRVNIQTTQADWAAGAMDNSVYLDTNTSAGDVQLTFPDTFGVLRDGTSGSKPVWRPYCKALTACTTSAAVSAGAMSMTTTSGVSGEDQAMNTISAINNYKVGTTFYFEISTITSNTNTSFQIGVSSYTQLTNALISGTFGDYFYAQFSSTESNKIHLSQIKNSQDLTICSDAGTPCQSGNISYLSGGVYLWLSTSNYSVSVGTTVIKAGSHTYTNNRVFAYLDFFYGNAGTPVFTIDNFDIKPETATYTSQLLSIGSLISSWGPTTISDSKSSATITYQFGSTSAASIASIANYQTASNGYVPTVSTNPYAGFKALFTSSITLGTARLAEYDTTWNEGGVVPSPVASVYDRRYWLSFTTATTSAATLDTILVWQRNKTFTFFKGINAGSFTLWRDYFYFGNSNGTGLVYKFDVGNNDDGAAITSSIITKAYDLGHFSQEKDIESVMVGYLGGSSLAGSFSMAYDLDRLGYSFSLGSAALNESNGENYARFSFPLAQPVQGREFQYQITKTGTDDRLKLYNIQTMYSLKEAR